MIRSILPLLFLCSCYHMKNARFVDESDTDPTATVWVCTADESEPLNVGGLMCADMRNVLTVEKKTAPKQPDYQIDETLEWRKRQPRVINLGPWDPVPQDYEPKSMSDYPVDKLTVP